jgi:hypothetical protein
MLIEIHPVALLLDDAKWTACPTLQSVVATIGKQETRVIKKPPALHKLIVDSLGITFRFSESNNRVHSLLIHFSVEPDMKNPKRPFSGTVILNGTELNKDLRVADLRKTSAFAFDNRPEPVAIGSLISVRLIPKGEYLAIMDVGWEDFVRYGWG